MKERILIAIKDEKLLEESAATLSENDYIVNRASKLSGMETILNAMPQDLLLIDSTLWINSKPDLLDALEEDYSDVSIIHLIPDEDKNSLDIISSNPSRNYLLGSVSSKEVLIMVNQAIRYKELIRRYQQMKNEFLDANKNLSSKSREFQELLIHNNNILDNINVGIVTVDINFKVTTWNPKIYEITGIEESSAIRSDLFTIMPWLNEDTILSRVKTAIRDGKITELGHLKVAKVDGSEIIADFKISPIKKENEILGGVITIDDITNSVHFQDKSDNSYSYLNSIVENATDAIISFDNDGNMASWNKGAQEIFGYTLKDVIGQPWDILISEKDRKRVSHLLQFVRKGLNINNFNVGMKVKSGSLIPVNMSVSLIKDEDDKINGISLIIKDISDTKRFRDQIIKAQRQFTSEAMISGMAKNFNASLTTLSANSVLLFNRSKTKGINEIVTNMEKIEVDTERIARLAKDFLLYARSQGNRMEMADIHDIIDKSLIFTGFLVNMQNIEIKREYNAQNSHILCYSTEIIQVFLNLFTNAQAAMPDGGLLTIKTDIDKDNKLFDHETLCIKINDTGIGIQRDNLSYIFDQFFTTKPEGKGDGLGLYVARSILQNHQGKIEVESQINVGTTFIICLPSRIKTNGDKQ